MDYSFVYQKYRNLEILRKLYYRTETLFSSFSFNMQLRAALLLLGLASKARAYDNNAPFSRLPTLGWSSWVSLGPGADHPVFDFCVSNRNPHPQMGPTSPLGTQCGAD